MYTIPHGADTYVYMDAFSVVPQTLTFPTRPCASVRMLETTLSCRQEDSVLTATGSTGYAVFQMTTSE